MNKTLNVIVGICTIIGVALIIGAIVLSVIAVIDLSKPKDYVKIDMDYRNALVQQCLKNEFYTRTECITLASGKR